MVAAKLFDANTSRQRVDRYELVGEIASGGMATVYLARLTGVGGFQRFVAIKRLHPHLAREQEFVEMFLDEARLAAGIHHPNVVSILEVGASSEGYYLVMEYVEGDTLARLLARAASQGRRLPPPIALRIVIDSLLGLHAAHELKDADGKLLELVHRDVSPQNVLVGVDGIARITDFGVARAATRLSATRVGQLKGKLAYMAPEQASGERLDRRADVFSAGVLIWETLAAKRLFKADNEAATLSRVMNEPIPRLTRVAPKLGPDLASAVARALDRDRDKRFPTALALAEALERAAQRRDGIADAREVTAFVHETLGDEIKQQREAVRVWLARGEPTVIQTAAPPSAPSSVSVAAMDVPRDTLPSGLDFAYRRAFAPRGTRVAKLAGLSVLLGLAGGGGFLLARSQGPQQVAPVPVPAAPPAVATPAAPVLPPAPATSSSAETVQAPGVTIGPRSTPKPPVSASARPKAHKLGEAELDVQNPYR